MTLVLHITGCKNAGKTRAIEVLLPIFASRGMAVGTLKFAERDHFDWESPGTDTDRHRLAGSRLTGILGEHSHAFASVESLRAANLADIVEMYYSHLMLVLTEGFHSAAGFRIEVQRRGFTDRLIGGDEDCFAVYGDEVLPRRVPFFPFGSETAMVDYICENLRSTTKPTYRCRDL